MTSEEGNHDVASSGAADPFDCDMPVQESQEMLLTESQSQIELTQNIDDFEDCCTQDANTQTETQLSQRPESPIDPLTIPWGRLIPQGQNAGKSRPMTDFFPRHPLRNVGSSTRSRSITPSHLDSEFGLSTPPPSGRKSYHDKVGTSATRQTPPMNQSQGINFIGLENIKPYDRFNEYVIGRSKKCDVVAQSTVQTNEDENLRKLRRVVHTMISNTHCRLFCLLNTKNTVNSSSMPELEVYIEDLSGNGTFVNNTTLLKRNERRIIHTGDMICLLNPKIVRKKIKNIGLQKELLDSYTFVFVNVFHQSHQHQHQRRFELGIMNGDKANESAANTRIDFNTPSNGGRKRGLVDVRSTNSKSIQRHTPQIVSKNKKNDGMPPPEKKFRSISDKKYSQKRRIEDEYDIRDEIGSGTSGSVRRAIHRISGKMVAVKVINLGNSGGRNRSSRLNEGLPDPQILAESSILQSLDHPYIVQLLDVFIYPGRAIYIVMELLNGGDLFDRIVEKGRYSEIESRRVMRRILAAIHYLHEDRNILHRDLKPENILCCSRSDPTAIKLSDFGLAKSITDDGLKTFCGTPQYFAPEVLQRRFTVAGRGRYGKEADMWSLGVIMYILICGAPPFDASASMDANGTGKVSFDNSLWASTSKSAKDLCSKMLTSDPSKRITIKDACCHEWILMADGDTHINPLADPVVLEAAEKRRAIEDDERKTPLKSSSSPPAPQSVLATKKLDCSNAGSIEKAIDAKTPMDNPLTDLRKANNGNESDSGLDGVVRNKAKEILSPHQLANFPTPTKCARSKNQTSETKRETLFSLVKQMSHDGNNRLKKCSGAGDNAETNIEMSVRSTARKDSENSSEYKATLETIHDGAIESEDSTADHRKGKSTSSSTVEIHDSLKGEGKLTPSKLKGKQTTLSSFFARK